MIVLPVDASTVVEYGRSPAKGSPWIVRLRRKRLFLRRTLSSDWFLEESQARTFAENLARQLRTGGSTEKVKNRPPGWTLHRPAR